jgi:hypothetical protein
VSEPLTIELSKPEVDLLQDAVAGWLAAYLVHAEIVNGQPAIDFDLMTTVGRKLGMNL